VTIEPKDLTVARRRAVIVFAAGPARESNFTDERKRVVYWQTLAWMAGEGLIAGCHRPANMPMSPVNGWWELTADGLRLATAVMQEEAAQ
jgi:hypothetical protein